MNLKYLTVTQARERLAQGKPVYAEWNDQRFGQTDTAITEIIDGGYNTVAFRIPDGRVSERLTQGRYCIKTRK